MSTRKGEELALVFSERIKQLIGRDSVSAFARRVGLKQASVDRYVKAVHSPNGEALIAVSTHCGVTTDWLLGLVDKPPEGYRDDNELNVRIGRLKENASAASVSVEKLLGSIKKLEEAL